MPNHNTRLGRLERIRAHTEQKLCSCPFGGNYRDLVNVDTPEVCPVCGLRKAIKIIWRPMEVMPWQTIKHE